MHRGHGAERIRELLLASYRQQQGAVTWPPSLGGMYSQRALRAGDERAG
jgi:hypothetical protein